MSALADTSPILTDDSEINEILERVRKAVVDKSVTIKEWKKLVVWMEENLLTEERVMKEYASGRVTGAEEERRIISTWMKSVASECFLNHQDEQASRWRDTAEKVEKGTARIGP